MIWLSVMNDSKHVHKRCEVTRVDVILQTKAYDWISSQIQEGNSITSADVVAYVQVTVYS